MPVVFIRVLTNTRTTDSGGIAMGIWDKIKGEFIDIVEWLDESRDTMVYRFERYQNEIKHGAKLVVRESQTAAFVNEGQLADVFTPGTYIHTRSKQRNFRFSPRNWYGTIIFF